MKEERGFEWVVTGGMENEEGMGLVGAPITQ